MREIKFRAWVESVLPEETGMYIPTYMSWVKNGSIHDIDKLFTDDYKFTNDISKFTLMQFTGLQDKNGTDIYEGDILGKHPFGYFKADGTKDGRYNGKEWYCFAVEWGEYDPSEQGMVGGYEYEIDGHYVGWNINVGGYDDETKDYEVIGNIYENPDLLKP